MSEIIEMDTRELAEAFQSGYRAGIAKAVRSLKGHLEVCNYKAVQDEECDVCVWAEDAIIEAEDDSDA